MCGRVFAGRAPEPCERCLRAWTQGLAGAVDAPAQGIALDGTARRRAPDAAGRPLPVVSAGAREARLVLAQRAVPEKANELSALPLVLEMLAMKGGIGTSDALGTPAAIAPAIIGQGADSVLALKGHQGRLAEDVQALVGDAAG
jgi:hypothetical protein